MLTTYRIAYGLVLAVLLGNVLGRNHLPSAPFQVSLLLIAFITSLCSVFVSVVRLSRVRTSVLWGLTLAFEALFVWYAWYSPAAPFALHEIHTLDQNAATTESIRHNIESGAVFGLLFAWFVSLPATRLLNRQASGREIAR